MTGCIAGVLVLAIVGLVAFLFLPKEWFGGSSEKKADAAAARGEPSKKTVPAATSAQTGTEAAASTAKAPTPAATALDADTGESEEAPQRIAFELQTVVNGNTLKGIAGDRTQIVRLLYIDAPPAGFPGYEESKAALADLVRGGELALDYEGDRKKDSRSRVLAYVFAGDANVNVEMVEKGAAVHWRPVAGSRFSSDLDAAEAAATSAKRGMWRYVKVMTQDMKRHVAVEVASDGSNRVTLTDGKTAVMSNAISMPLASIDRAEMYELLGLGEGDEILSGK
jgi:endonuclease YncB( thermonuclease family)